MMATVLLLGNRLVPILIQPEDWMQSVIRSPESRSNCSNPHPARRLDAITPDSKLPPHPRRRSNPHPARRLDAIDRDLLAYATGDVPILIQPEDWMQFIARPDRSYSFEVPILIQPEDWMQ